MTEGNKVRRLRISAEQLFELFKDGDHPGWTVNRGVPEDAELMNVHHLWPNSIELLIRSESFDAVKLGDEIPTVTPWMERKSPA